MIFIAATAKGAKMTTLEKAIETYGKDMQLTVAVEELSELIKEICKCKRGSNNLENIIEEMADCYIMLKQLEIIFDIDYNDIVMIRNNKIDRLAKRLEEATETCVVCGEIIPEGRQVCPKCEEVKI